MTALASRARAWEAREGVEAKGRRYLIEGRLRVERVEPGIVGAACRGAGSVYELGYAGSRWFCSCPARGRCAHLVALELVIVPAPGGPAA